MNQELLKRLKDNPDFKELKEYIVSTINELDSVKGLSSLSNDKAGEEAKIRHLTVAKLYEILSPFIEQRDKREHSTEEVNRAKQKAGL